MKDLEITKIVLNKYKIKFHELQEGEYTYIMPYGNKDIPNYIHIDNIGLFPLIKSEQFSNFIEFYKGDISSY